MSSPILKTKTIVIFIQATAFAIFATLLPTVIVSFFLHDLDNIIHLPSYQSVYTILVGTLIIVLGVFFRLWATLTFYLHKLVVLRFSAQSQLVTTGPYRFTRSPHYIGITLIFLGCVILLGSYVGLVSTILLWFFWDQLLRHYEEPKLERTFGEEYRIYCKTVPRWIGKQSFVVSHWFLALIIIPLMIFGIFLNCCPNTQEQLTEKQTIINGLNVVYQVAGNPENPAILFMPGWGARKDNVCGKGKKRVIEKLSQYFYVISPEFPGLARSQPPHTAWSNEDYATFIHTFLKSLHATSTVVMGQSFGGGVATTYAHIYPKDTTHLILVDATQGNRPNNWYYQLRFKWKPIFYGIIKNRFIPLSLKQSIISLYLGVPEESITRKNVRQYLVMTDIETKFKVNGEYQTLSMPTLLIWGEDDTRVTPLERAKGIATEIPNAKLVVIPDAGHLALYTHTEQIVKQIVNFVHSSK